MQHTTFQILAMVSPGLVIDLNKKENHLFAAPSPYLLISLTSPKDCSLYRSILKY